MSKNKIVKSVSFNITNQEDQEFLERIEHVNFSGYVKDLMRADLQKRRQDLKIVQKTKNGGWKIVVGE